MKTASKILLLIIGFFYLLQCSSNQINESIIEDKNDIANFAVIDYTKDTLYYIFNLISNESRYDTFRVTRTLWVADSCFGNYNDKNFTTAVNYMNKNDIDYPFGLSMNFHIDFLNKGTSTNLWNIVDAYLSDEIRLEEGRNNMYVEMGYDNISFLRVIFKINSQSLSQVSLNYGIDKDLNCTFYSKERIHTEKLNHLDTRKIGYCIDTVYKVEEKDIDWYQITGDTNNWWYAECNK